LLLQVANRPQKRKLVHESVHESAGPSPKHKLSSKKREWLLEMIWASDRLDAEYEEYDFTKDDQILEAFGAFMQHDPDYAWELYKTDCWF
jgi:hypothetical protein